MRLPSTCKTVHKPMDTGAIAVTKFHYRRRFLDCRADDFYEVAALRDKTRRKMKAGTARLEQGFDSGARIQPPHASRGDSRIAGAQSSV